MRRVGDRIDRYVIRRVLGRGGMGEVYEAHDSRLGRAVALKVLLDHSDEAGTQRMLREARAAAAFEHPNAVVVYDVGESDGVTYLAMELVRGRALREFVADGSVALPRRLRWLIDAARALDAAHRVGLVHRDIKPDNVMIRDDGMAKVLDFGIARGQSAAVNPTGPTSGGDPSGVGTLTAAGAFVGTPLYAAPEQLRGEGVDGRADQFSWGVMAYELCTGAPPWGGAPVALLAQILTGSPRSPREAAPDLPVEVERTILRALEKRPEDRFATMSNVADAIEPWASPPTDVRSGERPTAVASPDVHASLPSATVHPAESTSVSTGSRGGGRRLVAVILAVGLAVAMAGAITLHNHRVAANTPLVVSALACDSASINQPGDPDLARAIGVGACARLAIDLGLDWSGAGDAPQHVGVRADLSPGRARVSLTVAQREASGEGSSPVEAVNAAVALLRGRVAAPPVPSSTMARWGAKDAASARGIERLWRRRALRLTSRGEVEAAALVAQDPDSPWPYVLLALASNPGGETQSNAISAGLARVDKLPPARARAVRGFLLLTRSLDDREESLRLTRSAYAEAPDDAEVTFLHARVLLGAERTDEALAVIGRLAAVFPTQSLSMLGLAVVEFRDRTRDPDRDRRLIDRMSGVLPESLAWPNVVDALIGYGMLGEARRGLDLGERLGLTMQATTMMNLGSKARVELAALNPAAAREVAGTLLSDPGPVSAFGAEFVIASYWMEGRAVEAQAAQRAEIDRQRSTGDHWAARHANDDMVYRRWLGQPPPDEPWLAWLGTTLVGPRILPENLVEAIRCEIALARMRSDPGHAKQLGGAVLATVEQSAQSRVDDRVAHDGLLAETIALVRAVRGDEAAARRWHETERAPFVVRRFVAMEAALALERAHDIDGAEAAYLIAQDPLYLENAAFDFMASHVRLADLYRTVGRADEAARLDGVVARLWAKADTGLLESVRQMR